MELAQLKSYYRVNKALPTAEKSAREEKCATQR
jgi:hypothetical protein